MKSSRSVAAAAEQGMGVTLRTAVAAAAVALVLGETSPFGSSPWRALLLHV